MENTKTEVMYGTVNYFGRRGFGFIRVAGVAEDLFFHCTEFAGEEAQLTKGTKVEFELGVFKSKPCARNIRLLEVENS